MQPISIDNQPISATFFDEGKWLTDFITPDALEVQKLHDVLTRNAKDLESRITALWYWVASQVKYKQFIKGRIWIDGKSSVQDDLWNSPSITARVGVGNCANKSFLLASLLRNELEPDDVHCVLGNLHNGKPGGHAWVQITLNGRDFIMESTQPDISPLVLATVADRYEAVHFFNDQSVYAIEGRTLMEPFTACFSTWLKDYLDWSYIEGGR